MHIAALPQRSWLMWPISVLNDSEFDRVAGEQDVLGRDVHVVERELGLARAAQAHLHVGAGDGDAVGVEVDDDRADALRALAARGSGTTRGSTPTCGRR